MSTHQSRNTGIVDNPRQLALLYAQSVTTVGDSNALWVAKNGEYNLFGVLKKMLPEVAVEECCRLCIFRMVIQASIPDQRTRGRKTSDQGENLLP
jgi:hypothetical protein